MSHHRVKLIYIVGMGHSGSTLLELLIGSAPEVWSSGEVAFYTVYDTHAPRPGVEHLFICSCKKEIHQCPFWQPILATPYTIRSSADYSWHESVRIGVRILLHSLFPRYVSLQSKGGRMGDDSYALFEQIHDVAIKRQPEADYLLDASKDPRRLFHLLAQDRLDIYPVSIVRDGRAVVHSFSDKRREEVHHMHRRSATRALIEWIGVNLCSRALLRRLPNALTISYEALCQRPQETIRLLNNRLGIHISEQDFLEKMQQKEYHTIDGSYIKYEPLRPLLYDERWRREMPLYKKALLSFTTVPLYRWWSQNQRQSEKKGCISLGLFFLALATFWNVAVMKAWYGFEYVTTNRVDVFIIWLFDIVCVALSLGFFMHAKKMRSVIKRVVPNIIIFFVSAVVCISLFEGGLRAGLFEPKGDDRFVWIPERLKEADRVINEKNREFSQGNRFGFNDRDRSIEKPEGVTQRVAVVGDSFIWGDGVEYDTIWSHQLESLIQEKYPHVEVISWGKNGWSTKDQLEFLRQHAAEFDIDMAIVGFVTNDPDLGLIPLQIIGSSLNESLVLSRLQRLLPNTFSFFLGHLEAFLAEHTNTVFGYGKWEEALFSDENLAAYRLVLEEFSDFSRTENLPVLFVFTPNTPNPAFEKKYAKIRPLFEELNIPYLDLYPVVARELGGYSYRDLWANPANGHPNVLVTSIYAREVFAALEEKRYLREESI